MFDLSFRASRNPYIQHQQTQRISSLQLPGTYILFRRTKNWFGYSSVRMEATSVENKNWKYGIPGLHTGFHHAFSELLQARTQITQLSQPTPEDAHALEYFYKALSQVSCWMENHAGNLEQPLVIELEGLDGSGKTTLSKDLEAILCKRGFNVTRLCSPPSSIQPVRHIFDEIPGSVSRAYYMCSNYLLVGS